MRTVSDTMLFGELYFLWEANPKVYEVRKLWKTARRALITLGRNFTKPIPCAPSSLA